MANYNTTANVVLSVNGKQAQQVLATLQRDAQQLEKKLAKASVAGDKATMKKLQRDAQQLEKTLAQRVKCENLVLKFGNFLVC